MGIKPAIVEVKAGGTDDFRQPASIPKAFGIGIRLVKLLIVDFRLEVC
jgi:hypothetical protein